MRALGSLIIWPSIAFLFINPIFALEVGAGEIDSSTLAPKLILNLFGGRQERLELLRYLTSPKVRERMRRDSLNLRQVVRAMQVREFNREIIAELKQKGWVGETAQAALSIPPVALESLISEDLRLVREILNEENESRETLIRLISALQEKNGEKPSSQELGIHDPTKKGPKPEGGELEAVRRQFGNLSRQQARPGEWIQGEDGLWGKIGIRD